MYEGSHACVLRLVASWKVRSIQKLLFRRSLHMHYVQSRQEFDNLLPLCVQTPSSLEGTECHCPKLSDFGANNRARTTMTISCQLATVLSTPLSISRAMAMVIIENLIVGKHCFLESTREEMGWRVLHGEVEDGKRISEPMFTSPLFESDHWLVMRVPCSSAANRHTCFDQ